VNETRALEDLIALLTAHGVRVRDETLGESTGGLCVVNGRWTLFLDRSAPTATRLLLCAQAAARVVDVETVYVKPGIRALIQRVVQPGADNDAHEDA